MILITATIFFGHFIYSDRCRLHVNMGSEQQVVFDRYVTGQRASHHRCAASFRFLSWSFYGIKGIVIDAFDESMLEICLHI